ncbi:hypothetical protein K8R47_00045 [archaeon]|nr:hypothetical protein [archaeon]
MNFTNRFSDVLLVYGLDSLVGNNEQTAEREFVERRLEGYQRHRIPIFRLETEVSEGKLEETARDFKSKGIKTIELVGLYGGLNPVVRQYFREYEDGKAFNVNVPIIGEELKTSLFVFHEELLRH